VPRGAPALLPAALRPTQPEDWDWFWTRTPPPAQDGEPRVRWLDDMADDTLRSFLKASSPRYSAEPGDRHVRRWCGIVDGDGSVRATAAWTEYVAGVPHLASIATHPDARGRGLGAAVTAWITRELLRSHDWVTLGMYADNETARRMYRRLGYRDEHLMTSGEVPRG
ncbi:MAG: GNAT family N-acetyltransferase, partial [Actinomycetota bacterium]|nr:GNAT family N-acetyltransferase [Actinomycetota bacterium]